MARARRFLDSRGAPVIAAATLVAVGLVIGLRGVAAPWWVHADPDGAYVGSSLNILRGEHTIYLDHPGLPTQVGLAVAFGGDYLIQRARGRVDDRMEFVDTRLLDLDSTRPVYRTWAVLQYVGGALLAFVALSRLFRHWTWGLAGGLLFLATPGLAEIATLLRPDALMAALCLVVAVVLASAFESRDATRYLVAAALLGFAITVKLPAVGLVVPLATAAIVRPPPQGWATAFSQRARDLIERRRALFLFAVSGWLTLCVVFNRERLPIISSDAQRDVLLSGTALIGGFLGFAFMARRFRIPWADRVFLPFYGFLALAFVVGLALPATLVLDDGVQMPVEILDTLRGEGVNDAVEPFADFRIDNLQEFEQRGAVVVGGLALIGAALGALRRRWWPALLALGMAVLATMAAARTGFDYYFAPAFAVAIPGALYALRRRHRDRLVPLHAWIIVLLVFVPLFFHLPNRFQGADELDLAGKRLAEQLLGPGEVILTPTPFTGLEDTWYAFLVEGFTDYTPRYPHHFFEVERADDAEAAGFKPRYYTSTLAEIETIANAGSVQLGDYGAFAVRRVPTVWGPHGEFGIVEIVRRG